MIPITPKAVYFLSLSVTIHAIPNGKPGKPPKRPKIIAKTPRRKQPDEPFWVNLRALPNAVSHPHFGQTIASSWINDPHLEQYFMHNPLYLRISN